MKPVDEVARLRRCELPAARSFCEEVQSYCQGSAPTFKAIAQQLAVQPQATAEQIASRIRSLPRSKTPRRKRRKRNSYKPDSADQVERDMHASVSGWGSRRKNPLLSKSRVERSKVKTCPHGIPFYQTCAICNSEKFHEMIGL